MAARPVLGQHWLTDPLSLQSITRLADLQASETVLEIGTGQGHLTDYLLKTPACIISLEYDPKLYQKSLLKYQKQSGRLQLVCGDVRRFDWSALPAPYKICANIPYYLSSYLLRRLTDIDNKPDLAVLLLAQKVTLKLAERRKRSLLAVLIQSHYAVRPGPVVLKEAFQPPPKIDSQVAILKYQPAFGRLPAIQWPKLVRLFKLCFAANRKQLTVNLRNSGRFSAEQLTAVWSEVGFSKRRRAESLTDREWWQLFLATQDQL